MITFEAVDAGFGDCLLLRWTTSAGKASVMLVDGGPKSAVADGRRFSPWRERLSPRLAALKAEIAGKPTDPLPADPRLSLALVVCTHVDDDHIAGIDALYECIVTGSGCGTAGPHVTATRLWFNSFEAALGAPPDLTTGSLVAASIAQGANLTRTARGLPGLRFNEGQALIMDGQCYKTQFSPLSITILNPRQQELEELRDEWKTYNVKKTGKEAAQPAAVVKDVEPDQSIPNLSSIVFLVDSPDGSLLLTGDQRSDYVFESLRAKGLVKDGQKLHVAILKVPHHGSIRNNQNAFYDNVTADAYVFCANGKNGNPDPPVLEMIAESRLGECFNLVFTTSPSMKYAGEGSPFQDGFVAGTLQDSIDHLRSKIASDGKTLLMDPARVKCWYRQPSDLSIAVALSERVLTFQ